MAHQRAESSTSTHDSSASSVEASASASSTSLHLPSEGGSDSHINEHEGLFRAHTAARLGQATSAHQTRVLHDVRARASPVKLRFIRSPSSTISFGSNATSRIPLPRSTSAPDKLYNKEMKGDTQSMSEDDDGVQMALYPSPTPPLPLTSASSPIPSSSSPRINLDHPPRRFDREEEAALRIKPSNTPTITATPSHHTPSQPSPSSSSFNSPSASPSGLENSNLHAQSSLNQAQDRIQIVSPTPPKRHPGRPVLRSSPNTQTSSSAQSSRQPSPSRSTRQASRAQEPSLNAPGDILQVSTTPALRSPATPDVVYLSPLAGGRGGGEADESEEALTPSSAIFTSAFSSPLDSASAPRSFSQQQRQAFNFPRQEVTEIGQIRVENNTNNVEQHVVQSDAVIRKHKYSASNDSIPSRSGRSTHADDTAEEEILASTFEIPAGRRNIVDFSSPGLLTEGQSFGRLQRSHSLASSISSMTSGSESFSSSHQGGGGNGNGNGGASRNAAGSAVANASAASGGSSIGHSESFLDLRNVSATPRQARKTPSSSALNTTPRATPPDSNSKPSFVTPLSSAKASMALRSAMGTTERDPPKLSSSLERRRRDGTFGTVIDQSRHEQGSPASVSSPEGGGIPRPFKPRREFSDQGSISETVGGSLPRSGTVGDLSFSGSHVAGKQKHSPKTVVEDSPSISHTAKMKESNSSGLMPLGTSTNTSGSGSGSGSASTGSLAQSASTRLLPPSEKIKDSLSRSHTRRPEALHRTSSSSPSVPPKSEIKVPTVPGMEDLSKEDKKSWKKASHDVPWDITQPLWYKAPVWGKVPQKGMRAHSATLVPEPSFSAASASFGSSGHPAFSSSSFRTSASHLPEADLYALDPSPMGGNTAASLYVFGGCDAKVCFKELYKLDLQSFQWSKPRTLNNACAPPALRAHSTTYIPPFKSLKSSVYDRLAAKDASSDGSGTNVREKSADGHLMFFGGGDGPNYFNDLYLLNLTTMTWSKPLHEASKSPTLSPPDSFATAPQNSSSATEASVPSAEQRIHGRLPSPRRAHAAFWYDKRKELIIFGGGNGSKALNETWVLECKDWKTLTWRRIDASGKKPRVRGYHTMNLLGDRAIVFGGSDGSECFSDVFVLDLETFTWTEIPIYEPSLHCPRLSHSATLISPTQLLILGGHNGTDYKKDVTIFSLATGKFYHVTDTTALGSYSTMGPSRRGYHTTTLTDGRVVMIGGYDGKRHFDEVWCLEVVSIAAFSS